MTAIFFIVASKVVCNPLTIPWCLRLNLLTSNKICGDDRHHMIAVLCFKRNFNIQSCTRRIAQLLAHVDRMRVQVRTAGCRLSFTDQLLVSIISESYCNSPRWSEPLRCEHKPTWLPPAPPPWACKWTHGRPSSLLQYDEGRNKTQKEENLRSTRVFLKEESCCHFSERSGGLTHPETSGRWRTDRPSAAAVCRSPSAHRQAHFLP